MTDWFKKMTTLIDTEEENASSPIFNLAQPALFKQADKPSVPFFSQNAPEKKRDLSFADRTHSSNSPSKDILKKDTHLQAPIQDQAKDKAMTVEDEKDDNLKTLKRLRELPRGTQVDSRVAAIESLLGEKEVFKSLKLLRWPQGVLCPRCHSSNVVRREQPEDAPDKRHYYVCLNCKGEGGISDFDDFTGLPIGSIHALRQWIFCWYLLGFCSVAQIAKVLGLSVQEVIQMASLGADLTQLPEAAQVAKAKEEMRQKEKKAREDARKTLDIKEEDVSHSESISPTKPGYKSKK